MAPTPKLLVVEDDPNLGALLAEYLRVKGFEVDLRADGEAGLKAFRGSAEARDRYDLLLLDVMMPVKDGFTLAREIRRTDAQVPIIFLTAKSMKQDTIQGFQAGADDYLTKPFSMEELVLRVQAVLRRSAGLGLGTEQPQQHTIGSYTFDVRKQLLRRGEQERKLTTKESELLRLLCLHRNGLLERRQALREIWGDDNYFNGRRMDVYIAKLREDPDVEIINIHGQGFRLAAREQS